MLARARMASRASSQLSACTIGREQERDSAPRVRDELLASCARRADERLGAHVAPLQLEQVVRDQHHRHFGEDLRAELLAADAALQLREGQRRAVLPRHDLAVEHRAVGQKCCGAAISGKRSVTSSSPRDQMNVWPSRRITCARMPSHFHSACHSRASPSASSSSSSA